MASRLFFEQPQTQSRTPIVNNMIREKEIDKWMSMCALIYIINKKSDFEEYVFSDEEYKNKFTKNFQKKVKKYVNNMVNINKIEKYAGYVFTDSCDFNILVKYHIDFANRKNPEFVNFIKVVNVSQNYDWQFCKML